VVGFWGVHAYQSDGFIASGELDVDGVAIGDVGDGVGAVEGILGVSLEED
jgi:hypothetical protein